MTTMQVVIWLLKIKRNIFESIVHLLALWYFDSSVTYPQWVRRVKFVVVPPRFALQQYLWNIAMQPTVGCYNSWANSRCSGCSLLGEQLLWNRSIAVYHKVTKTTTGSLVSSGYTFKYHWTCSYGLGWFWEIRQMSITGMGVVKSRELRYPIAIWSI